jgi:endo-1,4-beta-xylanase
MFSLPLILLGLTVATTNGVFSLASEVFGNSTVAFDKRQSGIPNGEGTNNGFFYSVYSDPTVTGTYTNLAGGEYSLTWGGSGDVVVGKGWNPGGPMSVEYSGTFETSGNAYLSVYGWMTNPLVEYYITDSYGDYNPSTGGTYLGTCTSDGGTYQIYTQERVNEPSIEGTATFAQYWSIRTELRVGGTVTTGNHYACWQAVGLELGTFNYMILATEGYSSTGSSTITVGQGSSSPSGPTSVSSSPPSGPTGGGTVAEYGQCGGIGYDGPTVCAAPYTCEVFSAYYSQCL